MWKTSPRVGGAGFRRFKLRTGHKHGRRAPPSARRSASGAPAFRADQNQVGQLGTPAGSISGCGGERKHSWIYRKVSFVDLAHDTGRPRSQYSALGSSPPVCQGHHSNFGASLARTSVTTEPQTRRDLDESTVGTSDPPVAGRVDRNRAADNKTWVFAGIPMTRFLTNRVRSKRAVELLKPWIRIVLSRALE